MCLQGEAEEKERENRERFENLQSLQSLQSFCGSRRSLETSTFLLDPRQLGKKSHAGWDIPQFLSLGVKRNEQNHRESEGNWRGRRLRRSPSQAICGGDIPVHGGARVDRQAGRLYFLGTDQFTDRTR